MSAVASWGQEKGELGGGAGTETSIFGVVNVLVYNEGSAPCLLGVALADLSDGTVPSKQVVQLPKPLHC